MAIFNSYVSLPEGTSSRIREMTILYHPHVWPSFDSAFSWTPTSPTKRGSKIHGGPIGWQTSVKSELHQIPQPKIPVNRAMKHIYDIQTQAPPIHPKDGIEWPHQTSSNMPLPDIYPDPAPDSPWLRRLSLVAGQNRLQTSSDVGSAHHGCLDVGWFWTPINGYIYIYYIYIYIYTHIYIHI